MSVKSLKLSFFQISPKVWTDENHVYARTSLFYRILNLFFYSRTVVVDRIQKRIEIEIRMCWFFTSKKDIAFNEIEYIDIEKMESTDRISLIKPTWDSETWYVQVKKTSAPYIENLFRFVGSGARDDYWGTFVTVDVEGMQYEKALRYAELVSKFTESPIKKYIKTEYDSNADRYKCLACGHTGTSKNKCVYCGGTEMESVSSASAGKVAQSL